MDTPRKPLRVLGAGDWLVTEHPHGAVSVRWRKASASWVVYLSGRVLDSGFGSAEDARRHLDTYYPELAKRADYSRA